MMESENKNRLLYVDILRILFILCIILAHVSPPFYLHEIRSFDVVGLVILSSFFLKETKSLAEYRGMILKRLRRLLLPTYICLTIVFIFICILSILLKMPYPYDFKEILLSYGLVDGIGYVWIVRVLLINCILSPLIIKYAKLSGSLFYSIFFISLFSVSVLSLRINTNILTNYVLLYTLGYYFIGSLGYRLKTCTNKEKYIFGSFAFLGLLISLVFFSHYMDGYSIFPWHKHPPLIDWILYGSIVYICVEAFAKQIKLNRYIGISSAVIWFSKNSFDIYFAHVIILKVAEYINPTINSEWLFVWYNYYFIVLFLSIMLIYIRDLISTKLKHCPMKYISYLVNK